MTATLELDTWLASTAELRAELLAYAKSTIPTDPGQRQMDVSESLQRGQDAGDLLADCDSLLLQAEAQAMLSVRETNPDLSADERRALAKSKTADINRLRDALAVVYRTIKDRRFSLMNLNRSDF